MKPYSQIRQLSLLQFKNYSRAHFEFEPPVTVIVGKNGVGKTNLLDAVYFSCYTKSYFSLSPLCVQQGTEGFRIDAIMEDHPSGQRHQVSCKWKEGKKMMELDRSPLESVQSFIGRYAAVMIAPDDIQLINEGGEVRRKWMDGILAQTEPLYLNQLIQYQKSLQQRNAWLKNNLLRPSTDYATLDFYEDLLSQLGEQLYQARKGFLLRFMPLFQDVYQRLCQDRERIDIQYQSDLEQFQMRDWLDKSRSFDLSNGRTNRGVHRDDLLLLQETHPFRKRASQGQKKSALFALKLAQFHYIHQETGKAPILLLDDVFEKLDQERLHVLFDMIRQAPFHQILLTDTDPDRVREGFRSPVQMIRLGEKE